MWPAIPKQWGDWQKKGKAQEQTTTAKVVREGKWGQVKANVVYAKGLLMAHQMFRLLASQALDSWKAPTDSSLHQALRKEGKEYHERATAREVNNLPPHPFIIPFSQVVGNANDHPPPTLPKCHSLSITSVARSRDVTPTEFKGR